MDRLVAAMIAIFAGLALMPQYIAMQQTNLQETIDANAATQFQTILQGASKYVAANTDTLLDSVPVGNTAVEVPFSAISGGGGGIIPSRRV